MTTKAKTYVYKGQAFERIEDLILELQEYGVDVEAFSFTTDDEKFYDPQEFIKDANKYLNDSPPNLVQTAAKLWLAAVYTVKLYFLQMKIYPVSHKCMRCMVNIAIDQSQGSAAEGRNLAIGWERAELFHKYSYGSATIKPKDFHQYKSLVESFVEKFPAIDSALVKPEVMRLGQTPGSDFEINPEKGKAPIGRQPIPYDFKAF